MKTRQPQVSSEQTTFSEKCNQLPHQFLEKHMDSLSTLVKFIFSKHST